MLKLQYYGHLIQRANSLEKTLMLGNIEGKKRRGQQRKRWLGSIDSVDMNLSKFRELEEGRRAWRAKFMGSQRVGHDLGTEQQQQYLMIGPYNPQAADLLPGKWLIK